MKELQEEKYKKVCVTGMVEQKIEREEAPKITGTNKDAEVEKKPYVRKGAKVGRKETLRFT
jgi:hypothetical protein